MKTRTRVATALSMLVLVPPLVVLSGCGGNRPADQASAPAASSPAPAAVAPASAPGAAAPAETAAPPPVAERTPVAPVTKPKATPHATAKLEPAPIHMPRPEPVVKTIAAGTDLDAELVDGASSKTSHVGDVVRARVTKTLVIDGLAVVPAGATIEGLVTEAVPLKTIGGAASLGLRFDTLDLGGGRKVAIASLVHQQGKSETGKDAGTIAGATAGGALLGRLLSHHDKTKGTLIGAVVGAAAGTGAAAATKGQEVELPAGTALAIHLDQAIVVTVQP